MKHDESYRLLFSNPEMVADLLRGYVSDEITRDLDFSTLERVNASFVTEELEKRESDMIWKLRFKGRTLYVYLLLEFQSTQDHWMALRVFAYLALLYQEIQKNAEKDKTDVLEGGRLPPVLPIVLYKGVGEWRHPKSMKDLILMPEGFPRQYFPDLEFLLIDENGYANEPVSAKKNLVAALFALENSRDGRHIGEVMRRLKEWLPLPDGEPVLRAFGALIDEIVASQITALEWTSGDLLEVSGMLEQRIEIWKQEARQAGLLEGRAEGREEGRVEGELSGLEKGKAELEAAVRKIALNLKNQGLSSEKVSELTGLFIEDIDKLT